MQHDVHAVPRAVGPGEAQPRQRVALVGRRRAARGRRRGRRVAVAAEVRRKKQAAALGELTSSEATVVFSTEPLWGAAFASAMLHESMGAQCQLGGALMVIACIVSGVEIAPGAVAGAAARTLGEARRGVDWLVESCGLALGVRCERAGAMSAGEPGLD